MNAPGGLNGAGGGADAAVRAGAAAIVGITEIESYTDASVTIVDRGAAM
jgi:hypothetical protein